MSLFCFVLKDTATTEIYTYRHTLSLHDALPISLDSKLRNQNTRSPCSRLSLIICVTNASSPPVHHNSSAWPPKFRAGSVPPLAGRCRLCHLRRRSEEHTSELQSLMRNSYAVFCLKKKT